MDKESDCAEVVTLELILMLHTGDILVKLIFDSISTSTFYAPKNILSRSQFKTN